MLTRSRTVSALVLAGVLTVASAACSSDDSGGGGNGGGPTGETGAATGANTGGADLIAANTAFDPTQLEVASGDSITVQNDDGFEHTFTVKGTDVDEALEGGSTEDVTIDLDAGKYDFVCTIHPSMTGTITVT